MLLPHGVTAIRHTLQSTPAIFPNLHYHIAIKCNSALEQTELSTTLGISWFRSWRLEL